MNRLCGGVHTGGVNGNGKTQWQWHHHGMGWIPICDGNGNGILFDSIPFFRCHCRRHPSSVNTHDGISFYINFAVAVAFNQCEQTFTKKPYRASAAASSIIQCRSMVMGLGLIFKRHPCGYTLTTGSIHTRRNWKGK